MKFYNLKFESSSGIYNFGNGYYAVSKNNEKIIPLDFNRQLLVEQAKVQYYLENYDVYEVEYAGSLNEEKTR